MEKLKLKKLKRKIRNVALAESCQIASQCNILQHIQYEKFILILRFAKDYV